MYITKDDIIYQISNLRQVTFEITDACNLKCKYCAYGELYEDYDKRNNCMMETSIAIKLLDYLIEFWDSDYNLSETSNIYISFYGGEPLLNMPFVKEVVEYINNCKCINREFTFSMTTNATLLDKYMDYLVEHNFNLLISLDGDEYNNSYRLKNNGEPSYFEIIKNIENLKCKYPLYFKNNVEFNSVLHNRNSFSAIYDFFKTKYDKTPSVGELNNMGVRADKVELFNRTYRNSVESLNQAENYQKIEREMFLKTATYQTLSSFIFQHSGSVFNDYTDLLFGKPSKRVPTGTCLPFNRRMFVTVNGKILPCERIGQQHALGMVNDCEVKLDFEEIAAKYNNYFAKVDKQCGMCFNKEACIQCVFNLENLEGEPVCHGFMNEEQFNKYRITQMSLLRKNPEYYYRIIKDVIIE